jgi:hypothetical protein
VQCLYCETELKPLRGLFDEDFCCKDHREKYFSSFRKGITLLPVLDLPPLEPTQETNLEDIDTDVMADPEPERRIEVVEETVELPEPAIAMAAEEAPKLQPEMVMAVAQEQPDEQYEPEPVRETPRPLREILAKALEPVAVEEPVEAVASVEADLVEDAAEEAVVTPLSADFLHLHIAPSGAADCYFMVEENSFSACNGPAIPDVEVFCDAAFDPEECLAHLVVPADMAAGASGRAATPEPPPATALSPSFGAWDYATPSMPALETGELIEDVEIFVPGAASREMLRFTFGQPLGLPPASLSVPAFEATMAEVAQPAIAELAGFEINSIQIESGPLMFSDMAPVLEIHSPLFQVSAAAMQLDEELKRAIEPPKKEAARLAEPEIARPAAMSAAPASHAVSGATFQPTVPAAPARPEAQLNVPAMSSKTDAAIPGVASEAVPDPPRGAVAEQPPSAHSSEPVQPAIQNSVRIKNWRLKITFAKPA